MISSGFLPKKEASDWLTYLVLPINFCRDSNLWVVWSSFLLYSWFEVHIVQSLLKNRSLKFGIFWSSNQHLRSPYVISFINKIFLLKNRLTCYQFRNLYTRLIYIPSQRILRIRKWIYHSIWKSQNEFAKSYTMWQIMK